MSLLYWTHDGYCNAPYEDKKVSSVFTILYKIAYLKHVALHSKDTIIENSAVVFSL